MPACRFLSTQARIASSTAAAGDLLRPVTATYLRIPLGQFGLNGKAGGTAHQGQKAAWPCNATLVDNMVKVFESTRSCPQTLLP